MTYAYDRNIVHVAQELMAGMLDFGVNGLGYELSKLYGIFLGSDFPRRVETGDSRTVMGMSGIELAYEVTGHEELKQSEMDRFIDFNMDRSPEFWTGWALAYYQWDTALTFKEINDYCSIGSVFLMYEKYHEMDIEQFCDSMRRSYRKAHPETRLQTMRKQLGLSQKSLADMTGIPLKTIQQYEQRQKNINHANVDYMIALSRTMNCDIELLLEKV